MKISTPFLFLIVFLFAIRLQAQSPYYDWSSSRDIYVVKFNSAGNYQWVRITGSALDDRGNDIAIDHNQNLYITGEFAGRNILLRAGRQCAIG